MKKIFLGFVLTTLLLPMCFPVVSANDITDARKKVIEVKRGVQNVGRTVKDVNRTIGEVGKIGKEVGGVFKGVGALTGIGAISDFGKLFDSFGGGNSGGAELPNGDFELPGITEYNGMKEESLRSFILNVLNFTLTFLGIVAIAAVIYAGFLYVTSGGDDSNMEKAKKIVIYAVIGILVVLASYALVNTVIKEAATGGSDRGGAGGTTGPSLSYPNRVATSFSPGTLLPAGTVLNNGAKLLEDTLVNNDGSIDIPDNVLTDTDTLDLTTLLSFQNGITVSGGDTNDLGTSAIASEEAALGGIDFGLTIQANALFDFGDGTQAVLDTISSPGGTVSHSFGSGDAYQVRVIAQTVDGKVHTFKKSLIVGGTTADFSLSRTQAVVGENITMDASLSRAVIGSIKSYSWSCSGTGNGCFPNVQGSSITVSFGAAGTYDIKLLVENALGTTDELSKSITILNDKPVANFTYRNTGNTQNPLEFEFNANSSQNISGEAQGLLFEWDFDGDVQPSSSPLFPYRFNSEGNKTITLVVTQQVNGRKLKSETTTQVLDAQITLSPNFNINQ